VIKIVEGGRASTWFSQKLKAGDEVRIQCPLGNFMLDRENPKDFVFMCTATGIAPFISQLRTFLPQGETRKIDLFFGLLHERELFWKDELDELVSKYPNFSYYVESSEPWDGYTGYVQEHAATVIDDFSNKQIYLCGSPIMTKAVKEVCMNDWNVPNEDIHMEGFI
jgi:NAD(P)H-flavin reductase